MSLENVIAGSHGPSREAGRTDYPTTVFDFDPTAYAEEFRSKGYVLIKDGVTPEFIGLARKQLAAYRRDSSRFLSDWEIENKKQQYLFDFPDADDNALLRGVMDTIAAVTGMASDKVTVSECHLKIYAPNAHPNPPAHKDRFASKIAVGIPLFMPTESAVIVYPNQSRDVNEFDSAEEWRNSLAESELPENALKNVKPENLFVGIGDVVMLSGSALYHERENGANAVLLYLKFNDMGLDPLAEDPFVDARRTATLENAARLKDRDLLESVVELSPRLVRISRHHTRNGWGTFLTAQAAGGNPFSLSEDEWALLRRIRSGQTARELLFYAGVPEAEIPVYVRCLRRLGEWGGIEILS